MFRTLQKISISTLLLFSLFLASYVYVFANYGDGNYGGGNYNGGSGGGDTTPPTLATVTPVPTPGTDTTPTFVFSSNEAGTITYGGPCSSGDTSAIAGNNFITFNTLTPGVYSTCTITVTDAAGNTSTLLPVNTFEIQSAPSGGSSGGGGGGGGGGSSSSHSNDIVVSSVISQATTAAVGGMVKKGTNLAVSYVASKNDKTPECSDSGSLYINGQLPGLYSDGSVYSFSVLNLQPNTKYYLVTCLHDGGKPSQSAVYSFTTKTSPQTQAETPSSETANTPVTPVATSIPKGFTFKKNVSFIQPEINDPAEIMYLERFLNDFEGENLPIDGVYGPEDVAAVKRFQKKYKKEVLDIWNLDEATGYVGITTRLKMNFLLKGQTAQCPAFVEYNGGKDGIFQSDEVRRTQELLKELGFYHKEVSGYWNPYTNDAMAAFQEKFHEVMLDPWGIKKGTGYKYKTTNKFLNYFAGCDTPPVELEGVGAYDF